MHGMKDWALTLGVFIPLVGAALMMVTPRAQEEAHKAIALVTSIVTLGFGGYLLAKFDYDKAGLQFKLNHSWIDAIHSRYRIGIDGISLPLLILSMVIVVLVIVYSWNHF